MEQKYEVIRGYKNDVSDNRSLIVIVLKLEA